MQQVYCFVRFEREKCIKTAPKVLNIYLSDCYE